MPGFTHLQTAQPVTFGHHMMAWFEMLERDQGRLQDCNTRLNQCPLGAAALAGTTFPIDREFTARELGFDGPCRNSLDAVSDRDFAIEFTAAADMVPEIQCNPEAMRQAAMKGFATATDLADYLVRKGIPFRDAHEVVGKAVALCVERGIDLAELGLEELRSFSEAIGGDVFQYLTLEGSVAARNHIGGTAPEQVRKAVAAARRSLK